MNRAREPFHYFVLVIAITLIACLSGIAAPSILKARTGATLAQRLKDAELQHKISDALSPKRTGVGRGVESVSQPGVSIELGQNPGTRSTIFYYDDMESGTNGWSSVAYMGTPVWHQTTADENSPTHSWWAGDEATGTYNTGHRVDAALISPPINLTTATGAVTLMFTENYSTEFAWDFCMVDVSEDGTNWTHLRGGYAESATGESSGWILSSYNLTPWAGKTIQVRFNLDTGDSLVNDFRGWFVDNVTVFDQSGTLAGSTYFDWNQNGIRDDGDDGLDFLIRATGPVTITTRSGGGYFLPLPLGTYTVTALSSDPWTQTAPPQHTWDASLTLPGQYIGDLDFGYWRQASYISGTAFDDINRDSLQDGSDTLLVDHGILLLNGPNSIMQHTSTDSLGRYSFIVFDPQTYYVSDYLRGGRVSTVPAGSGRYTVDLTTPGQNFSGLTFGSYQIASSGTIAGSLFNDADKNGLRSGHEDLISGIWINAQFNNTSFWCQTDSLGAFQFTGLFPGVYQIMPSVDYTWKQSTPDTVCTVTLTEGATDSGIVLGIYRLPLDTIEGFVFNDLNRNGIRDSLEGPLAGWTVNSSASSDGSLSVTSDSSGHFTFPLLVSGDHHLNINCPPHWVSSIPGGSVDVLLADFEKRTGILLSAYLLRTGTISGTFYADTNGNQVRDAGETPLAGWPVQLTGKVTASTVTDQDGNFHFDNLWAGKYKVNTILRNHWRQTQPASLAPYFITLGDEQDRPATDFGLMPDPTFSLSFRTFLPESIALSKDIKRKFGPVLPKADHCAFSCSFRNNDPVAAASMTIIFRMPIKPGSLTVSRGTWSLDSKGSTLTITFNPPLEASVDTTVVIHGIGVKPAQQAPKKAYETLTDGRTSIPFIINSNTDIQFPMPNALNVLYAGAGTKLGVGLGGPNSVIHPTYKDVMKSLLDSHGGPPVGPPRCIGFKVGTTSPLAKSKPVKYITPTQGNNRLFTEAIAFKANIRASDLWITPPSFTKLVFHEAAPNPFNGLTMTQIAAKLDTAISAFDGRRKIKTSSGSAIVGGDTCLCTSGYYDTLYRVVRMIDSAFSGPIDTTAFGHGLVFAPVRSLDSIPYLQLDSSFTAIAAAEQRPPELPAIPGCFELGQNYPNPFNPSTTIEFYLVEPSVVTLKVYNTIGQEVATLINHQMFEDGWQQSEFSAGAASLASGVYFYRLTAQTVADDENPLSQTFTLVKKMMYIK
jgi:hypothetical protein